MMRMHSHISHVSCSMYKSCRPIFLAKYYLNFLKLSIFIEGIACIGTSIQPILLDKIYYARTTCRGHQDVLLYLQWLLIIIAVTFFSLATIMLVICQWGRREWVWMVTFVYIAGELHITIIIVKTFMTLYRLFSYKIMA